MKKTRFLLSVIVVAALALVSFDKSGPKEVAKIWLTGFYHLDYNAAMKVSTEDTKAMLTQLAALVAIAPDSVKKEAKGIVVTIGDVKEDGDKATVSYTIAQNGNAAPSQNIPPLKLVKQNGKWLVQFTKNDLGLNPGAADTTAQGEFINVTDTMITR